MISRSSAAFLAVVGLTLLFAPDAVLPRVIPAFPPAASWIGEIVAAGWLALAMLNWTHRFALLGGIYGRPIVLANALFFFVNATTLLRAVTSGTQLTELWWVVAPVVLLTVAHGLLLFRGPLGTDFERSRSAASPHS